MPVRQPAPGDLEPIETASRDEIAALQLQRLRQTLRHAYDHVPHYRQAFDARGVHPDDLKTLADLAKFPFTTKKDLRDNYPFGLFAVPRTQVARIHASSGTTGKPTVVGYTSRDIDTLGRSGGALHPRRRRPCPATSCTSPTATACSPAASGAHYGAERLGCTVIPMSGGQTEKQVQLIRDFQPDLIMVTPSYMQVIVEEFARQGLDPREMSVKVGIFGAEPWTEAMRREIEEKRRDRRGRHLRPVGGDGPGRGQRMRGKQGRPGDLGGPLLPRDHRPGDRRGAARRLGRRAGLHHADQGGAAGHPLPHPRPHPAAAADLAQPSGAWARSSAAATTC